MPTYYCPRCSKSTPVFRKTVSSKPSSYVVGHIGGNDNFPLIGVPVGGSSRYAPHCKICGEEVSSFPTTLEQKELAEKHASDDAMFWVWTVIGAIIVFFVVAIQL